jgi:RNA polymerase sigma-70 factor, ECF subfamily
MPSGLVDRALAVRLHREANAERWHVDLDGFAQALERSAARAFPTASPDRNELANYLESLRLEDLALACACEAGDETAWDHFMREHRPTLYRAADSLDPSGGARDLADSLYAELYGLDSGSSVRKSLFRYFHGRSSLTTWLRTVLSQRHVDRIRAGRRTAPLPEEETSPAIAVASDPPDPDRPRYLELIQQALERATVRLAPRDRLRLAWYYVQGLTLAQVGRLTNEHEATVSRQLARTRRALREDIEQQLRNETHLSEDQIGDCFRSVTDDPGSIDLREVLHTGPERKKSPLDRSLGGEGTP